MNEKKKVLKRARKTVVKAENAFGNPKRKSANHYYCMKSLSISAGEEQSE